MMHRHSVAPKTPAGSAGWGGKLRITVLILLVLVGTKLFFICELYLDDIFDDC